MLDRSLTARLYAVDLLAIGLLAVGTAAQDSQAGDREPSVATAVTRILPVVVRVEVSGGRAPGSGFVLDGDRHVATASVVVGNAGAVCCFADGRRVRARNLGCDEISGLAILQLETEGPPAESWAAALSTTGGPAKGRLLVGVGLSGDMFPRTTLGAVCGTTAAWSEDGLSETMLRVNPPSPAIVIGGPLVSLAGDVEGIQVDDATILPSAALQRIAGQIISGGGVTRTWVGLRLQPPLAGTESGGVLAAHVYPGSPAADAGFRPGDLLRAIGGSPVAEDPDSTPADAQLAALAAEAPVRVEVQRGARRMELTLVPRSRVEATGGDLLAVEGGLRVVRIPPASVLGAAVPALVPGDLLQRAGGQALSAREDLERSLASGGVLLHLVREGEQLVSLVGRPVAADGENPREAEAVDPPAAAAEPTTEEGEGK